MRLQTVLQRRRQAICQKGHQDMSLDAMLQLMMDRPNAQFTFQVRREKALVLSGEEKKTHPGTGSLHPVAIEAAAEATKLSELSV